jgi:hypothetical protein
MEKNGTFLEGDEDHDVNCEKNCVFDFIAELLEDPNPYYIIIQHLKPLVNSKDFNLIRFHTSLEDPNNH